MLFKALPDHIEAAWKEHLVAGIVMQGRSQGGRTPIFSELVGGGTSLYGYQVGFDVNITATSQLLRLDIVFDPERTQGGPVPANVRFELNALTGRMGITELPADALELIQQKQAALVLPCDVVMALAMRHP